MPNNGARRPIARKDVMRKIWKKNHQDQTTVSGLGNSFASPG